MRPGKNRDAKSKKPVAKSTVKQRIAEAIQGKRIMLPPASKGGMNLKTTDINRLIETLDIKALSWRNDGKHITTSL